MTQFATTDDLAARLGITLTADEQTRAAALLEDATGIIQDETGQTLSLVTDDVLTRPGSFERRLRLPQRPVVSVASVALDGTTVGADAWYLDGDELVRRGVWPVSENRFGLNGPGWGYPAQTLTITYTHGYSTVPPTVKTIAVEMVARVWNNPASVIQERVGNVETTYAPYQEPPRGLMLTDVEKARLHSLVGRTAGSIALR